MPQTLSRYDAARAVFILARHFAFDVTRSESGATIESEHELQFTSPDELVEFALATGDTTVARCVPARECWENTSELVQSLLAVHAFCVDPLSTLSKK